MAKLDAPAPEVLEQPITLEDAKSFVKKGTYSDEAALRLTISDAQRAEEFESTKEWMLAWPSAATLYQAPYSARYWEGTKTERANVTVFTVAQTINSLLPAIMREVFADDPEIEVMPRTGTSQDAARAIQELLVYQLQNIEFKESCRLGIQNGLLFGTTIWKWGWEKYEVEKRIFKRKVPVTVLDSPVPGMPSKVISSPDTDDNIEIENVKRICSRPFFEPISNLKHLLVDPDLRVPDVRKAKYIVHRMYMTWRDLEKLRDRPGMKLPSKDELMALFFPPKEEPVDDQFENNAGNPAWDARAQNRNEESTDDPLSQPLEVLERWDNDTVIMVLNRKLTILNDENPYNCIPYLSVNWWDVPEAFYGLGLAKIVGNDQRIQQGVLNAWLDHVSLNLNPVYTRVRGKNVPSQPIRMFPGKIVDVDSRGDFEPLMKLGPIPEAIEILQLSQQRVEQASGASESAMGGVAGASGHSNLARSATGASMLASGASSRVEEFAEKFLHQVFRPFLYKMFEMIVTQMPADELSHILNNELEMAFLQAIDENGDIRDSKIDILEILNADVTFDVLASTSLSKRRAMAQSMPIMMQFLNSQPIIQSLAAEKKKVDISELIHMLVQVSGWRNYQNIIVDMSPEDIKHMQAQSPAAVAQAKNAGALALQQQAQQAKSEAMDQNNIDRAANLVLRQTIEKGSSPEEVTGEPGGAGFQGS